MNIVEYNSQIETEPHALTRIKTRAEIEDEQNVVAISGSNSNGKATVYVDVNTPAVVESTVQLGLIDAFLSYRHVSGSASRNGNKIDFIAYGEGMVKIIIEGIELYKYSTIIEGYCNSDGTGGEINKILKDHGCLCIVYFNSIFRHPYFKRYIISGYGWFYESILVYSCISNTCYGYVYLLFY